MLSIAPIQRGNAEYYLRLAAEDYYFQGGEPPGQWWGRGADDLGLRGIVEPQSLLALLNGTGEDGQPLVKNAGRASHRPGFDLTFSAPKSVSVFWAVAAPESAREVRAAHDAAVRAAMAYVENHAAFGRTGKGGSQLHAAGIAAALFEHGTSRALDPQLHTHAVLANVAVLADGHTTALNHPEQFAVKMTAGALYQTELAAELEKRLGLRLSPDKDNGFGFVVPGVPRDVCEFYSKRRAEVEAELARTGNRGAWAAAKATLETRSHKSPSESRHTLHARWRAEAAEFGLTAEGLHVLSGKAPVRYLVTAFERVFATATETLAATQAHFTERELHRAVFRAAIDSGLDADRLLKGVAGKIEHGPELVRLNAVSAGPGIFATAATVERERELGRVGASLRDLKLWGLDPDRVERAIAVRTKPSPGIAAKAIDALARASNGAIGRPSQETDDAAAPGGPARYLSHEQAGLVRFLTRREPGGLRCVEGLAGTSKTSSLAVAAGLWREAGYRVIGAAVSGRDARQLAEGAGIENTHTVASLTRLTDYRQDRIRHEAEMAERRRDRRPEYPYCPFVFDHKSVLVIDEASMADTKDLLTLLQRAEAARAMVVLVGDRKQLQAIGAGGGFAHLADSFGKQELTAIVRQKNQADRDMVRAAAKGDARAVYESLIRDNRLTLADDRASACTALVERWAKRHTSAPARALILAGTRQDVRELNTACQARRREAGLLGRKSVSLDGYDVARGDRVVMQRTSTRFGVDRGERGTVTGVCALPLSRTLTVQLDRGKTVTLPLSRYHDVGLGYATTTHAAQGATAENVYVLAGGPMQDRELTYVQLSRMSKDVRVFVDRDVFGKFGRRFLKDMARSQEKTLAVVEQGRQKKREQDRGIE